MNSQRLTPEKQQQVAAWYKEHNASMGVTARQFRIDPKTVSSLLKKLGVEQNVVKCQYAPHPVDPTPEEIESRCADIRAGWTEE